MKDYPQLSIRVPNEIKATLQALSIVSSRPQWRLITDAIACYLRECPEPERRMVDELVGRSRARLNRPSRRRESRS